jgi:predicted KAP-like P-loop ATPase
MELNDSKMMRIRRAEMIEKIENIFDPHDYTKEQRKEILQIIKELDKEIIELDEKEIKRLTRT